MSAVAERPITITAVPRRPATEKDACALALSYLRPRHAGGAIRSRQCSRPNWERTGALRCRQCRRPSRCHQPARWGGRSIHWYHTDEEVLGYVPGAAGGYQVPVAAIPQLVRCTHASV